MNIGALRHRISIASVVLTQDAYGGVHQNSTAPFVTIWGEVQDLSGRELYTAEELHSQITTKITVRFYPGINPSMVATVSMDQKTRTFDILSVNDPDGRRVMLELSCKERVD
jgi:SPP1 family predicted phage head-tail adaptor